jgi:hypothetical protein
MPTRTITEKLKISEGSTLLTLNAPPDFKKNLGDLPPGVKVVSIASQFEQIHWFVLNKSQLDREMVKVLKMLQEGNMVWVYYPKSTSKMQTDLSRDKGWESLLKCSDRLAWINLISFDDTWSAFGFRAKTEADRKRETKPKSEREVFKYVNPSTKQVTLPDDLDAAFRKHKKQAGFFDTLSFTNKKEYIEWIVTAKREDTRAERVQESLDRLSKGWKNPANR